MVIKKPKTTAKTTKKPTTASKTAEERSAALWKISGRIEENAYNLAGVRDVMHLYLENDCFQQYSEGLYLLLRELERMENALIACSDEIIKLRSL